MAIAVDDVPGETPLLAQPMQSIQIGLATPIQKEPSESSDDDITLMYLLGQKPAIPRPLSDKEKDKLPRTIPIEGEYNIKIGG